MVKSRSKLWVNDNSELAFGPWRRRSIANTKADLLDRFSPAGHGLPDADLKSLVVQAKELASMNRKRK